MQGLSVKGMKKSIVKSSAVLLGSYLQGAFSSQTAVQAAFLSSFNTHRSSSSLLKSNLKLQRYTPFTDSSLLTSTRMTSTTAASEATLLLPYEDGSHGSAKIIIDMESDLYNPESLSIDDFQQRLEATIIACKELNKSALWLEVHMSQARYIQACTDIPGLELHHTEGAMIKLSLWLKDNVENKIPDFATHQVGVGAIVVNSHDEILCVRELRRNFRKWKIPGGLSELGESLDEAAIREVKEETGVDCVFKSVLGFRHSHNLQFGRSDMYFVCRLEPVEVDGVIPIPEAQEGEIAAADWVPLQEYKDMINGNGDDPNPHPMMQTMMDIYDANSDIQRTVVSSIVPGRKASPIYHVPTNKDGI